MLNKTPKGNTRAKMKKNRFECLIYLLKHTLVIPRLIRLLEILIPLVTKLKHIQKKYSFFGSNRIIPRLDLRFMVQKRFLSLIGKAYS